MAKLFSPFRLKNLTIPNRVFLSPMCQYSAIEGVAQPWHLVHLGARAAGGCGLVMVEATGVEPEGRISPGCLGLWNTLQRDALRPICDFVKSQGSIPAIQLAHAGRKASTQIPWAGGKPMKIADGGWQVCGPSPLAFDDAFQVPMPLGADVLARVKTAFVHSAQLALEAGFEVVEIHMAHGYLLHEFLSPLSNQRGDDYGGSLQNRMRFPLEIAHEVRKAWPSSLPLFVRISATDWAESGGWDLDESVVFCQELKKIGVDLIDVSSGGTLPRAKIPVGPHFQVPLASEIRKKTGLPVGAVGLITDPLEAEKILVSEKADAVFLGRELLKNPHWPLNAAQKLGVPAPIPKQYLRGF